MPPLSPSIQLLTAIWNLWQSLVADGAARLRQDCGVDLKGLIALGYLQPRPYQSTELADAMQMPRYEVSRLLRDLESAGLVSRERVTGDGRQVRVTLTPAGQTTWECGLKTVEAVAEPYLAGLDGARREELILTLAGLVRPPQGAQR